MVFETLLLRERFFVYGLDFRGLYMGLLKINGKEQIFPDNKMPATIEDLLRHLGVDSTTVVAELDGQIVERAKFSSTNLRAGQNIELVRFVPGG
jgi:thiamine biosynthesis protein ThiS